MSLDLKSLVGSAVAVAFDVAGQIALPSTFSHYLSGGTYSPTTGINTPDVSNTAITPIFCSYKASEIDGDRIQTGDKRIVVKASELPGIEVQMKDYITESGTVWQIMHIEKDPTNTVYILNGRKRAA